MIKRKPQKYIFVVNNNNNQKKGFIALGHFTLENEPVIFGKNGYGDMLYIVTVPQFTHCTGSTEKSSEVQLTYKFYCTTKPNLIV